MGSLMPAGGNSPPRWPCVLGRPPRDTHLLEQPGSLRKDSTLESWSRDLTASPLLGSDVAWGSDSLRKLHPHLCVAKRSPRALWPPLVPAPRGLLTLLCSSQYTGCWVLCWFLPLEVVLYGDQGWMAALSDTKTILLFYLFSASINSATRRKDFFKTWLVTQREKHEQRSYEPAIAT